MAKRKKKNQRPIAAVSPSPPGASGTKARIAAATAEMSTPQRIAWYALHAMVFAVPVAIANWTWLPGVEWPFSFDQFDVVKVVVLRGITLVALAAWLCHMLLFGGVIRRTKVDYLILAMLGWLALSTALSIHPETALFGKYRRFEGLISFVNYAVVYFLAVQFLDRISRVRSIARTFFFSGMIVGGYGVLQYLGVDPLTWAELPFEANRAFSTFGNPNMLGGFLVILLPIAVSLALSEPDHRWRALYWSGVMLTALCWVVTFTRGAWIAGVVALIALGIAAWRMRVRPTRVDWSFAGAAGILAAVAVGRSLATDDPVMNAWNRLVSILEFGEGSALTRFQIWDAAWRATLDRPIFGFGLDTFRLIFPGYKPVEYTAAAGHQSVADNAHNYILQLTAGVGIPGMLLVYGVFVAVAVLSLKTVFAAAGRSRGASGALLLSGMWAAVIGYLVHLTFGISVAGSTFFAWILFAALMSPSARAVELRPPAWGRVAAAAAVLAIGVASAGNAVYLLADRQYLLAHLGPGHEQRLAHAKEAVRLNPFNDMYRTRVGLIEAEAFLSLLQQERMQAQAGMDTTAIHAQIERAFRTVETSLTDTIEFVPHEYDNYMFITNVYNIAGQALSPAYFEEAKRWARKGIGVSEFGPGIRLQYALALDATGQTEDAKEELRFAFEMDPAFVEPRRMLGEIYLRDGDSAAALEQFEQIRVLNPQFPGIDEMIAGASGATGAAGE